MKKNKTCKKFLKITAFLLCAIMFTGLLAACGTNNSTAAESADVTRVSQEDSMDMTEDYAEDIAEESAVMESAGSQDGGGKADEGVGELTNVSDVNAAGKKLIKDVEMSVETKDFDSFIEVLKEKIAEAEGYIEKSDISGGGYQYTSYRYGYIQIRIPADKLESFVKDIGIRANVTRTSETTTDITLQYVDTESHIKALKTEQDALLRLLEEAAKMADIMAIQSQLTQVRYELESYESQIRTFDNKVNYSTVNLEINEVERETTAERLSFFEEVKYKLSDNMYNIKENLRNFTIGFISGIPYFIIWGVVIVIIVLIGRKIYTKYKIKKISSSNNTDIVKEDKENKEE